MLLEGLYTLQILEDDGQQVKAEVKLNQSHEIFEGHFPSQPVLPGVCLLEMLKSILSKATNKPHTLSEGNNIKYLKVVDPRENDTLHFHISYVSVDHGLKVTATSFLADGSANFKFKGIFI